MATLFISDLHLQGERSPASALFQRFLQEQASRADALYILGDLFEAWLGDDLILPEYQGTIAALRAIADGGVPIYLMHGNRDFLLGDTFARLVGCRLIGDPLVIDLYGTPTLLTHGDLLCTDDLPYQAMRRQLRDPKWVGDFLARSPQERIAFAQQLRTRSQEATSQKAGYIMDVNGEAVAQALRDHGVRRMIHGHTHRPGRHAVEFDGDQAERLVLGAWEESARFLACDEDGCRLLDYPAGGAFN